jgi:hypothetical protein
LAVIIIFIYNSTTKLWFSTNTRPLYPWEKLIWFHNGAN